MCYTLTITMETKVALTRFVVTNAKKTNYPKN